MKRLVCEMCDGTDFMKDNGVFVCQTCGMKYSVAEAKKMMTDDGAAASPAPSSGAPAPAPAAPPQQSSGVSQQALTLLDMATNAYDSGNAVEALSYANRVIELDPENYMAWLIKGLSAGWESNLRSLRLQEMQQCIARAAVYVPEDETGRLWDLAEQDYTRICLAITKLYCDHLAEFPDNDTAQMLSNALLEISKMTVFHSAINESIIIKFSAEMEKRQTEIPILSSTDIIKATLDYANTDLSNTYTKYHKAYQNQKFPDKTELGRFLDKTAAITHVLVTINNITESFAKIDPSLYQERIRAAELHIKINNDCILVRGWEWVYRDYNPTNATDYSERMRIRRQLEDAVRLEDGVPDGDSGAYYPHISLTADAAKNRRNENTKLNKIVSESRSALRKAEEEKQKKAAGDRRKRIESYWEEHAEEKQQLDSEREALQTELMDLRDQVRPFDEQIEQIRKKGRKETPSQIQKRENAQKIKEMTEQKANLGIFKGKEKKALQEQIDQLYAAESDLNRKINEEKKALEAACQSEIEAIEQEIKPIRDRIAEVYSRISEIDDILTQDRK